MRNFKLVKYFLVIYISTAYLASAAFAADQMPDPDTYLPLASEVPNIIKGLDDPTDLMVTYPPEKAVPPEVWEYLKTDKEEAKRQTAEILGFKSPDLVNKIAPEIKSGKYTYKDLEKYPGLKELFPPEMLLQIKAAGPPYICSVPEFEIIPTRQLYWWVRLCEKTKENLGKTKLDKDGYIVPLSWDGGFPFPRPSGKFKAQELYYSFEKRNSTLDNCFSLRGESFGYNRNLKRDKYNQYDANFTRLMGRTLFPPYGWFDKRAKSKGEFKAYTNIIYLPRSLRGNITLQYIYDDPYKMDPWMVYVPSLRRIRKMTATDTQDPMGDSTYDDRGILAQKITPERYPYKFEIIGEREYLMPVAYNSAKAWIDSKNGYALRGVQFMRRPCYTLQMTQLDPNYVYSKRVIYIDKETFTSYFAANYDQRGRLYRHQFYTEVFMPETGMVYLYGTHTIQFDHIDRHSSFQMQLTLPANFSREDFTIQKVIQKSK